MRRFPIAILTLTLLNAVPASGQVSIGVGAQYMGFGGSDFEGTNGGLGGEARIMFAVGPSVALGANVQYSAHGSDFFSNSTKVLGLIGEARYSFVTATGKATPYVSGRAGYAHAGLSEDLDGNGTEEDLVQSGFAFGIGGGVLVAMSGNASLDLGVAFHSVSFGDVDVNGTTISDTNVGGTAFQFRAGVSFKLGSK